VEPRSIIRKEDSTVPGEAAAGVICGSRERAYVSGIHCRYPGGAFLQFRAKAMTSWKSGAAVSEKQ
jgi:hypothetical protein